MGYIYVRKNTINGKMYIGQTNNIKQRDRQWRCLKYIYSNDILEEDRQKYGPDAFESRVLVECDDSEMDKWERRFIDEFDTIYPNGYNKNEGGETGWHHSRETIKMISDSNKESCKDRVDELTERLRPYQYEKGNEPWNKGLEGCFSEDTREMMAEARRGKKLSKETRTRMGKSRMGIFINRKDQSKIVDKISPIDGEILATYPSAAEAARSMGIRNSSIRNGCRGGYNSNGKWVNCNTIKGYVWRYHA